MKNTQLLRSTKDRMIAGVCGGIAAYFNIDSSLVRFAFIMIILLGGSGILVYLILWIILPDDSNKDQTKGEVMEKQEQKGNRPNKKVGALFLIGMGTVMLLQNFGFADYLYLDKTWPAIFVILGLFLLSK